MKPFFLKRRPVPSYAPVQKKETEKRSVFFDPRVLTAFAILALFASSRGH